MRLSALMVAALCVAGPVQAGGPVEQIVEPAVEPAATVMAERSWTGFYAGVSAVSGTFDNGLTDFGTSGFGVQAGYLRDLGTLVIGGELAYSRGDFGNDAPTADWDAIRLKLIGGYDAGRFLPYAFVGMTRFDVNQAPTVSDTMPNYGLGVRVAMGSSGKIVLGLEYLVESKDNFGNSGSDVKYDELSLRLDYRF